MIMDPIKEALTFDDVTMAPKYSEVLPSEVDTSTKLSSNLTLKIPLLSSAMDTVTESKMAIAIAKAGGIGVIHRNLDIKKQVEEIKKVKKLNLLVGAAVGAGPLELKRAEAILKEKVDLIVVDTAHGHSKKVAEIIKAIKKLKTNKTTLCAGNIATAEAAKFLIKLGVDIIKVGIGPGSICTTRLVAGIGVPQLSAILAVKQGVKNNKVKIISDGGIKYSGDLAKALSADNALAKSPEYLIPPSEIIFTLLFLTPCLTASIALNCGTPIPATSLVVQIDPGPIPTLIISTPNFIKNFAASAVAIFPAHRVVLFVFNFFIALIISATFLLCP